MTRRRPASQTLIFVKRAIVAWTMGPIVACSVFLFQNCNKVTFGNAAQESLIKTTNFDYTTEEDTPLTVQPPSNLTLRGTASLFRILTSTRNGVLEGYDSKTGKFTYRPNSNFTGQDQFDYSEEPEGMTPMVKTVRILILPLNDTPMILTDEVSAELNKPKTFSLMVFDVDDTEAHISVALRFVNGNPVMTEAPTTRGGRVVPQPDKTFIYYPPQNFRGIDKIVFYAKDSSGALSNPKEVRLNVANPFETLKPALAIRGSGCNHCHSNIGDNFITDLGIGSTTKTLADSDHFSSERNTNPTLGHYSEHTGIPTSDRMQDYLAGGPNGGFLNASFEKITVPRVPLANIFPGGATSFEQVYPSYYLTAMHSMIDTVENGAHRNFRPFSATTLKGYLENIERLRNIWPIAKSQSVARTGNSNPAVVTEANIYIGIPTAQQITSLGDLGGSSIKFHPDSDASPGLSGLVAFSNDQALRNVDGQDFICDGDLFLSKPLLLKNVSLATIEGCRIHSTKPIMVSGPIRYKNIGPAGQSDRTNLQLLSTDHVSLGVGKAACDNVETNPGWFWLNRNSANDLYRQSALEANPFKFRNSVTHHVSRLRATSGMTDGQVDNFWQNRNASMGLVLSAANQSDLGVDASCEPEKPALQAPGEPLYATRRRVDFEKLLIVAPRVDSRYTGQFKGAIVAEAALFSLSKFAYRYDRIFDSVPVFPMIPSDLYLKVQPLP